MADLGKIQGPIHLQQRQEVFGCKQLTRDGFEGFGKTVELVRRDRQAAGVFMTAELLQMLGAAAKSID